MKLRPWLLIGAAALALGACGKRGALERPPPLWGKNPQPQRTSEQKIPPPETQNVPIAADRVGDTSDPVGAAPTEPH